MANKILARDLKKWDVFYNSNGKFCIAYARASRGGWKILTYSGSFYTLHGSEQVTVKGNSELLGKTYLLNYPVHFLSKELTTRFNQVCKNFFNHHNLYQSHDEMLLLI